MPNSQTIRLSNAAIIAWVRGEHKPLEDELAEKLPPIARRLGVTSIVKVPKPMPETSKPFTPATLLPSWPGKCPYHHLNFTLSGNKWICPEPGCGIEIIDREAVKIDPDVLGVWTQESSRHWGDKRRGGGGKKKKYKRVVKSIKFYPIPEKRQKEKAPDG